MFAELGIVRGERIALVGAGGKTGLAERLIEEARACGWSAVFTTTTRILPPERRDLRLIVGPEDEASLEDALRPDSVLCVASRWLPEWDNTPGGPRQKLAGFTPEQVDRLADLLQADLLVVEADGSRHLPFKAPAAHEPRIPPSTTLVLVLAGLSVLGRPLNADTVHRPERIAALACVPLGSTIDPARVARVLAHPEGGRKGVPPDARAIAVLTQADADRRPAGREIARRLLRARAFSRVVLVDLEDKRFPPEVWPDPSASGAVHAVVLAAGGSLRMGQNKLLLPLGGKPLVAHAVDAALGSLADEVWVVLGSEPHRVRAALAGRPVRFLYNRSWREGLASSIRRALAAAPGHGAAVLFLAGDMPWIPPRHLDRLIDHYRATGAVAVWSQAGEVRGVPALFDARAFPALRELRGDIGGRALLGRLQGGEAEVAVPPESLSDIDVLPEYERATQWTEVCAPEQ